MWTLAHGMKVYKNAFKGEDFVTWMMREQNLSEFVLLLNFLPNLISGRNCGIKSSKNEKFQNFNSI
jgi:hypothetical protein